MSKYFKVNISEELKKHLPDYDQVHIEVAPYGQMGKIYLWADGKSWDLRFVDEASAVLALAKELNSESFKKKFDDFTYELSRPKATAKEVTEILYGRPSWQKPSDCEYDTWRQANG